MNADLLHLEDVLGTQPIELSSENEGLIALWLSMNTHKQFVIHSGDKALQQSFFDLFQKLEVAVKENSCDR